MVDPVYEHVGDPGVHLMEECAELIKAVAKGMRFGWECYNINNGKLNLDALREEFVDVSIAYRNLMDAIDGGYDG